jgi:hypothetical protein
MFRVDIVDTAQAENYEKLAKMLALKKLGRRTKMQNITPFLWFDGKAEEAMNFYLSIFKNSKVGRVTRYGEAGPGPKGAVMSATFQLEGQEFMALNGGPQFGSRQLYRSS